MKSYLIILISLVPLALSAPSASKLERLTASYSAVTHKNSNLLSKVSRQASQDEDVYATLGNIAAHTLFYYGCDVFPLDEEQFGNIGSQALTNAIAETTDEDFDFWDLARKFTARVVTAYNCAGQVTPNSNGFEDRFKAAKVVVLAKLDNLNGDPELKAFAADFLSSYGCGSQDTENGSFIILYLSTKNDAFDESNDSDTGLDIVRIHFAKLVRRLGCGNPNPNSSAFRQFFNNWAGVQ